MRALILAALIVIGCVAKLNAQSVEPRDGWRVIDSDKPFETLLEDLRTSVRDHGFGVVTQAGPTGAAAARGIEIPQNRVVGVFNNVYAVRILEMSTAAMIEAPIRFYLTEDPDGTATLSWKTPSFVFAPYADEAGPDLLVTGVELDSIFEMIAADAVSTTP